MIRSTKFPNVSSRQRNAREGARDSDRKRVGDEAAKNQEGLDLDVLDYIENQSHDTMPDRPKSRKRDGDEYRERRTFRDRSRSPRRYSTDTDRDGRSGRDGDRRHHRYGSRSPDDHSRYRYRRRSYEYSSGRSRRSRKRSRSYSSSRSRSISPNMRRESNRRERDSYRARRRSRSPSTGRNDVRYDKRYGSIDRTRKFQRHSFDKGSQQSTPRFNHQPIDRGHRSFTTPSSRDNSFSKRSSEARVHIGNGRAHRMAPLTVPPPPPLEPTPPLPPSPDISDRLEMLAESQGLRFSKEKGIDDPGLLFFRLIQMDQKNMQSFIENWERENEECAILALKHAPATQTKEREPFGGEEFSHALTGTHDVATCFQFPYNSKNDSMIDPRGEYAKEYERMSSWASRPREAPHLDGMDSSKLPVDGPCSPTYSWSTSPTKVFEEAEAALSRKSPGADSQNRRNSMAEAIEDSKSAPATQVREAFEKDAQNVPMELEEGYFRVKLPDGEDMVAQYGDISELVKEGYLPEGWPAFREVDNLWVPVYSKGHANPTCKLKEEKVDLSGTASYWEEADYPKSTTDEIHDWLGRAAARAKKALSPNKAPFSRCLEEQYPKRTLSDLERIKASMPDGNVFDFATQSHKACESLDQHFNLMKARNHMRLCCGIVPTSSLNQDEAKLAAVRGHLLENRSSLQELGTQVLLRAIKHVLAEEVKPRRT